MLHCLQFFCLLNYAGHEEAMQFLVHHGVVGVHNLQLQL